jgi:hypothetical protein
MGAEGFGFKSWRTNIVPERVLDRPRTTREGMVQRKF